MGFVPDKGDVFMSDYHKPKLGIKSIARLKELVLRKIITLKQHHHFSQDEQKCDHHHHHHHHKQYPLGVHVTNTENARCRKNLTKCHKEL